MRWVAVWAAVFFAAVSVFVAMPRPALLWVANSLDVFGDVIVHVANRTNRPVEPASNGGNSSEKRRTSATLQADRSEPARAVAQARTRADESGSGAGAKTCRPATIRFTQPWKPEKEPEYVASFGAFTPDFEVEPDEQWEQLGEHRTQLSPGGQDEGRDPVRHERVPNLRRRDHRPNRIHAERNSVARGSSTRPLRAGAHDTARTGTRSRHAQSPGDCRRRGETQSCLGKVPAGRARGPRRWRGGRAAGGHSQGRAGPDACTAEGCPTIRTGRTLAWTSRSDTGVRVDGNGDCAAANRTG